MGYISGSGSTYNVFGCPPPPLHLRWEPDPVPVRPDGGQPVVRVHAQAAPRLGPGSDTAQQRGRSGTAQQTRHTIRPAAGGEREALDRILIVVVVIVEDIFVVVYIIYVAAAAVAILST